LALTSVPNCGEIVENYIFLRVKSEKNSEIVYGVGIEP
jgi:hypothetical protein